MSTLTAAIEQHTVDVQICSAMSGTFALYCFHQGHHVSVLACHVSLYAGLHAATSFT
jgi:hypothetical protein